MVINEKLETKITKAELELQYSLTSATNRLRLYVNEEWSHK